MSTLCADNEAHVRKGERLVEFNAKKYFSYLAESSKFTLYCQNQFFRLHFYNYTFLLQF